MNRDFKEGYYMNKKQIMKEESVRIMTKVEAINNLGNTVQGELSSAHPGIDDYPDDISIVKSLYNLTIPVKDILKYSKDYVVFKQVNGSIGFIHRDFLLPVS